MNAQEKSTTILNQFMKIENLERTISDMAAKENNNGNEFNKITI